MSFPIARRPSRPLLAAGLILSFLLAACGTTGKEELTTASASEKASPADLQVIPAGGLSAAATVPTAEEPVTYEGAEATFKEGKYAEARTKFERYVETKPENPWGHYMLGLAAWKSGDFDQAEQEFDRVVELDATHVKGYLNGARVLLDLGRGPEAMERVEHALRLDSTSLDARRIKARIQAQGGDVEGAKQTYREVLVQHPKDVWSMNNLGLLALDGADPEGALGPLARAVQLQPSSPVFQNNLGMALERAGHLVAATQAYGAATKADATYTKALKNFERLSAVKKATDVVEVDLPARAEQFRLEVEMWRDGSRPPVAAPGESTVPVSPIDPAT